MTYVVTDVIEKGYVPRRELSFNNNLLVKIYADLEDDIINLDFVTFDQNLDPIANQGAGSYFSVSEVFAILEEAVAFALKQGATKISWSPTDDKRKRVYDMYAKRKGYAVLYTKDGYPFINLNTTNINTAANGATKMTSNTTLNLKLATDTVKTVKVNLHFSLEGKKFMKETDNYLSYVNYPEGIVPSFINMKKGVASVALNRQTGAVLFKSFSLIGTIRTKYKDSNNLQYSLVYGEYITRGTLEEVDTHMVKTYKVVLTILVDGKMSLTIGGKILTDKRCIEAYLSRINEIYKLNISLLDYYLSRSPKIQGTSWEKSVTDFYYNHTYDYVKKSVYRKVYKNDIKGATAALLWHPQASKAVVKKVKDLLGTGNPSVATNIAFIRDFISTVTLKDPQGFNNFSLEVLGKCQNLYHLHIPILLVAVFPKIVSSLLKNNDDSLLRDTYYAYLNLRGEEGSILPGDFEIKSLKQLHDILTQRVTELQDVKSGLVRLPTLNELPVFSKDGYTVRSINAHDLPSLGKAMSICVGMYKRMCWLGTVNISAVYDSSGKPIACLEWYYGEGSGKGYLVQAKLFANKKVCTDDTILDLVSDWCTANDILEYTSDMGQVYEGANAFMPPKPDPLVERKALLKDSDQQSFYGM